MSCLGVHFALTADEVAQLRALDGDDARLDYVQGTIEEGYFSMDDKSLHAESDKAWDAMHRALASSGAPLDRAILGGELLYDGDDYVMSLKTPDEVRAIAAALAGLTDDDFRARYRAIDEEAYGFPLTDDDCAYTLEWLENVRALYARAAADGRWVLFTVDQ